jgi:integrase
VPKIALTDVTIRALKPPERGQTMYFDTAANIRGFALRVSSGGTKTFVLMTGPENKRRREVLGRYPDISLQQARIQARRVSSQLTLNERPTETLLLKDALALYFVTHCMALSEAHRIEVKRTLRTHLLPPLERKLVADINVGDLTKILDPLSSSTPSEANHTYSNIKTFLNWFVRRGLITYSPLARLTRPAKLNDRDRTLSDEELKAIYIAAQKLGYPFGTIVLLAIHSGLRRANIAGLQWEWITPDAITIPATDAKGDKKFVLPNLVNDILQLIPNTSPYLFPSEAGTPFSAFSKSKKKLDALCNVENWTLHDLRRTFRTNLSKWRCCSIDIAERLIDHAPASKIEGIYDRWHYFPEMKEALVQYEHNLALLWM